MKNMQDLPNTHGFKFIGINHEYEKVLCSVSRNANNFCCEVLREDNKEPYFFQLCGWEDLPK